MKSSQERNPEKRREPLEVAIREAEPMEPVYQAGGRL